MNNVKACVLFESNSGYAGHASQQAEVRRGLAVGFQMWQTIIPDLQIRWVDDPNNANFKIYFGNYTTLEAIAQTLCAEKRVGWSGCSAGNILYMNDGGGMPFDHDAHTFVDRMSVYKNYEPATYPPVGYVAGQWTGFTGGRWRFPASIGNDAAYMAFHEFAHSLGMQHLVPTLQQWSDWYGRPKNPADGSTPAQPYVAVDQNQYPDLPVRPQVIGSDPTKYFGGGTPEAPWTSALNQLSPIVNSHYVGAGTPSDGGGVEVFFTPEGIVWPATDRYNSHIVFPSDVDPQFIHGYTFAYPRIAGLIRMQTAPVAGSTPKVYLTNDWSDALAKSKQTQADQTGGYFVVGLHPRNLEKPKLAAGFLHTLAIRNDGTLWAWGDNSKGQLGNGSTTSSSKPVKVGTDNTWEAVAAGDYVSFGLKKDGTLWSWGSNQDGQLGNGSISSTPRTAPDQVCKSSGPVCYGNKYVTLSVGSRHVLALRNDGSIWAWGRNSSGQLGDKSVTDRQLPVQTLGGNRWISIAAGADHSVGLTTDGQIFTWGGNSYGQLGQDDFTNTPFPAREASAAGDWTRIAAGHNHTLAMKANGSVWGWGANTEAQLGTGSSSNNIPYPTPTQGEGLMDDWSQLSAGVYASGGIQMNGKIYTWGFSDQGILGNADLGSRNLPGTIYNNPSDWSSFYMGPKQAFAFKTDGRLYAWGNNSNGQLGVNSTGNIKTTPQLTLFSANTPTVSLGVWGFTNVRSPGSFDLRAVVSSNVTKVEFYSNGAKIATVTSSPFNFIYGNVPKGKYSLTAKAYDGMGTSKTTLAQVVSVFDLSNWSSATAASTVNLTTAGNVDWGQWGLNTATDFNHKSGVTQQIMSLSVNSPESDEDILMRSPSRTTAITWTDGTPTASGNTKRGMTGSALGFGYYISCKASTGTRTFKLYLNVQGVNVDISADLGSSTVISHWNDSDGTRVYSLTMASGDPSAVGLGVTVKITKIRVAGGSFTIQGASLSQ